MAAKRASRQSELRDFLASCGSEAAFDALAAEEVDVETLGMLSSQEFADIGVRIGDRARIRLTLCGQLGFSPRRHTGHIPPTQVVSPTTSSGGRVGSVPNPISTHSGRTVESDKCLYCLLYTSPSPRD